MLISFDLNENLTPSHKTTRDIDKPDFARFFLCCTLIGTPNPPTNLRITDCYNRTTALSWITGASHNASITHFLVEQKSEYPDDVYRVIKNVTNPNATSVLLHNLPGWAKLRFRVRAVNRFGPSRASLPTTQLCKTKVGGMFSII